MKNTIAYTIPGLLTQAEDCAEGAAQYGVTIGVKHNLEAGIRADISALLDERDAYAQAVVVLKTLQDGLRTTVEESKSFLYTARDVFKPQYGRTWSQGWIPTGFTKSFEIPQVYSEIQPMVQAVGRFLASNQALERADSNVTAARAEILFNAISDARTLIHAQKTQVQNLFASRNLKAAQLRKRLSGLVSELKQLLPPLDNRWLAFGLNKPGAPTTPQAPSNVTAVLIGPNAVSVQWEQTPYASYYRVWAKVIGVDQELINIGDIDNTEFTIQPVATGAQLEIAVSAAVTGGGESAKSEVVTVTMPN